MLDKGKLYYMSHPYTSIGDPKENKKMAAMIQELLVAIYEIDIVNPILMIPEGMDDTAAMEKCRHLYNACDAVILCPDWNKSKGCITEERWAQEDMKPTYAFIFWTKTLCVRAQQSNAK